MQHAWALKKQWMIHLAGTGSHHGPATEPKGPGKETADSAAAWCVGANRQQTAAGMNDARASRAS